MHENGNSEGCAIQHGMVYLKGRGCAAIYWKPGERGPGALPDSRVFDKQHSLARARALARTARVACRDNTLATANAEHSLVGNGVGRWGRWYVDNVWYYGGGLALEPPH